MVGEARADLTKEYTNDEKLMFTNNTIMKMALDTSGGKDNSELILGLATGNAKVSRNFAKVLLKQVAGKTGQSAAAILAKLRAFIHIQGDDYKQQRIEWVLGYADIVSATLKDPRL